MNRFLIGSIWVGVVALAVLGGCGAAPKHSSQPSDREHAGAARHHDPFASSDFEAPMTSCTTSCSTPSSVANVATGGGLAAAGLDRAMDTLQACLSNIGADGVEPVIWADYASDGRLKEATIDVGEVDAGRCATLGRAALPNHTNHVAGQFVCRHRCIATDAEGVRHARR